MRQNAQLRESKRTRNIGIAMIAVSFFGLLTVFLEFIQLFSPRNDMTVIVTSVLLIYFSTYLAGIIVGRGVMTGEFWAYRPASWILIWAAILWVTVCGRSVLDALALGSGWTNYSLAIVFTGVGTGVAICIAKAISHLRAVIGSQAREREGEKDEPVDA